MNDFDFFTGTWNVRNRWRTDFLDETSEWEEFPGICRASRHFGGAANFDEIDFPTKGFSGLTLRLYDPERAQWSLYFGPNGPWFPPPVTSQAARPDQPAGSAGCHGPVLRRVHEGGRPDASSRLIE